MSGSLLSSVQVVKRPTRVAPKRTKYQLSLRSRSLLSEVEAFTSKRSHLRLLARGRKSAMVRSSQGEEFDLNAYERERYVAYAIPLGTSPPAATTRSLAYIMSPETACTSVNPAA